MRGADTPAKRRRLLARLAGVVTVSDIVRRWFLEGVAEVGRPPVVLPNALDFAALPEPLPPDARETVILFAGRVVPDKAPDALVAACALALPRLPGWRAEIIGTDGFSADVPDSRFMRDLRPRAAAAGVAMLGYRPQKDVLEALSRAAIAVVPSRWDEPFGLAALEAMGSGAALVCSMRGGLAEVVGEAGLVADPDDPAALAAALVRLGSDGDLRAALAAAGRARAIAQFSLMPAIARLDHLRQAIISGETVSIEKRSGR
jgi:glycosyltransferase involved in cell wall biosynthesis